MDAMECILTRRSVRQYTPEKIDDDTVRQLLEAAMSAPTACNQQPWEFVVVDDPAVLAKVKDVNVHAAMAAHAPLAVLVCADPAREPKCPGFWIQDCAAAMENLLLAARALGLGGVWTASYPVEARVAGYRELFGLPGRIVPVALAVIGHPAQDQHRLARYDAARIHRNAW
ncbi:MAG: nitroreductase family protein [Desulfovibrionaceae bacterium]